MILAAIINIIMWIGAIFLESKHSLALVTTTLIITIVGAVITIWNSSYSGRENSPTNSFNSKNDTQVESSKVNEPLPDPMDYDIEMPFS